MKKNRMAVVGRVLLIGLILAAVGFLIYREVRQQEMNQPIFASKPIQIVTTPQPTMAKKRLVRDRLQNSGKSRSVRFPRKNN